MLKQRSALSYNYSNNNNGLGNTAIVNKENNVHVNYPKPTQQIFLNNKENNPLVTNIDRNEEYPFGGDLGNNNLTINCLNQHPHPQKILQANHNICNLLPQTSKAVAKSFIIPDEPENASNNDSQSHIVAQQLIKDVRALAIQNQKTEQNLRELQQKINLQKNKQQRNTMVNHIDNKENQEAMLYSKQTRNHSYSIQPLSSGVGSTASTSYQSIQETVQMNPRVRIQNIPISTASTTVANEASVLSREQRSKPLVKVEVPIIKQQNFVRTAASEKKSCDLEKKDSNPTTLNGSEKEESLSQRFARILINENYSLEIINYLKEQEFTTVPKNSLLKHNIPQALRAKMVDWMVEVMKSYKCSEETFFMAVRIMDHFLEKSKKVKEIHELHLIGVTCIFIACKFEEIYPMRLSILQERIAHNKLSQEQIKSMEAEILQTLNFNLLGTSPYDIAMHALTLAGYQERFSTEEFSYGHKICVYLCKMALYDYEFNKTTAYSLLGASVIYIVFKIFQQINSSFSAEQNIKHIVSLLNIDYRELVNSSTRILHLAKNFTSIFPELNNLQKFNGFDGKQNQTFCQ